MIVLNLFLTDYDKGGLKVTFFKQKNCQMYGRMNH